MAHIHKKQSLILRGKKASDHSSFDRITEFSIRAPELSSCFYQVGDYYRWFKIDEKSLLKEDVLEPTIVISNMIET